MRRLGQDLGVEAMSLYKHLANKDELLAGVADRIAAEFALPSPRVGWRTALREYIAAHAVLLRHPWGARCSSRCWRPGRRGSPTWTPSSACCGAGFSLPDVAHAFGALDSHLYGFTMQVELAVRCRRVPRDRGGSVAILDADLYPNLLTLAPRWRDTRAACPWTSPSASTCCSTGWSAAGRDGARLSARPGRPDGRPARTCIGLRECAYHVGHGKPLGRRRAQGRGQRGHRQPRPQREARRLASRRGRPS